MRLNTDLMNIGNGFLAVPALIQNAVIVFGRKFSRHVLWLRDSLWCGGKLTCVLRGPEFVNRVCCCYDISLIECCL